MASPIEKNLPQLKRLLLGLPAHLPVNPSNSTYPVQIDAEFAEEESKYAALNKALHASVGHRGSDTGLVISERGDNILSIIEAIQFALAETDSHGLIRLWISDIQDAAIAAGAKEFEVAVRCSICNRLDSNESN